MNRSLFPFLAAWVLAAVPAFAQPASAGTEDVPLHPVPAAAYAGWTNAYRLANDVLEVVIAPDAGRIVALRYGPHANLLHLDPDLRGAASDPGGTNGWRNIGGDWLWPAAQSRWPAFQDGDWPPSPAVDGGPWAARAWKTSNGNLCCLMTRETGAPLHLRLSRRIQLDPVQAVVTVHQRAERTAPSDVPVALWSISQVDRPDRVYLSVATEDSAHERGFAALMFGEPGEELLTRCEGAIAYRTGAGEHKLCADPVGGWVASRRGRTVLIERATPGRAAGSFPDGGCSLEVYANAGLGYAEIETLSREAALQAGESLENERRIECLTLPADTDDCAAVDVLNRHLP